MLSGVERSTLHSLCRNRGEFSIIKKAKRDKRRESSTEDEKNENLQEKGREREREEEEEEEGE